MKSSLLTEHKNKSTTDNQWEFLRLVAPPQLVIHIGAGSGKGELHQWRQWQVPCAVLIEADEARLDWASSSLAENPQWHTACAVLSDVNAEADFYTASNPGPPKIATHDTRTPILVEVCLNDEFVGLTCLDGLSAKFGSLQPSMSFLHSALGFESGSLVRLLLNVRAYRPIIQWIHDLSFACESVTLVRNGITCGVPLLGAKICEECSFNSSRASVMAHYDQIKRLSDCQVFPSLKAQSRSK